MVKGDKIKATYRVARKYPSTPSALPFNENEFYVIIAKHSGKCLDVKSKSKDDGAMIQQFRCMGGDNQKWKLEPVKRLDDNPTAKDWFVQGLKAEDPLTKI